MTRRYPSSTIRWGLLPAVLLFVWTSSGQADTAIFSSLDRLHPVYATQGMVATQEALATGIGLDILKQGGNAVDAGVAIGFALAVTLPRAGNLGGGGFMLIHDAAKKETVALDFREMAPLAATRDLYLDEQGEVDEKRARFSYLSVGVPGTVAGLSLAAERYGTLPLTTLLGPAIRLADYGFPVSEGLALSLKEAKERMLPWPESMKIFFASDGMPYEPGETLVQKDLATSLKAIADHGPQAFYQGDIAQKIAADMKSNGGLITLDDLRKYQPIVREPVRGTYRGYEIVSMPPPSSGGIHLIQILNILENYPIGELGHNGAATLHRMAEAMKLAYADRSEYLGDPDFVKVPMNGLISKRYAAELVKLIDPERARPSNDIKPGNPVPYESDQTTHFSVMDKQGNVVSTTYTLNFSYGAGITAAGTGILLNNEMDDFSAKPGVPNAYGLIGGEANAIGPGKRPLSSMSPTIVFKDGKPFLATGSPGGSRIITTVLQIVMNVIDHGMNIAEATVAPRVHHQWLPDELRIEEGISPDTVRLLEQMGHHVKVQDAMGSTQSVMRREEGLYGYSDTRIRDALTLGY
ncbi:MAG: gamma-glutamyltransferase [Gammaproteobacteria bacterium]|nr:gamma-glutamyltransferase [Gammaproteobacteria bacterium]MCP5459905.1 gamma-glutamyltransferase [Gammaproteobacteria bacterium]